MCEGGDTYFTRWYIARGALRGADNKDAERVTCVVFRGVMWRSAEVNNMRVWQQLSQSWPDPFMKASLQPLAGGGEIQAHKGIAAMAHELHEVLLPHLRAETGARAVSRRVLATTDVRPRPTRLMP